MPRLLLAVLLAGTVVNGDAPKISSDITGESFVVTFSPGAVWACTVFEQQATHPDFPDGYKPMNCWILDEESSHYEDQWFFEPHGTDWLIHARVGWSDDLESYQTTNFLTIHR